MCVTNDTWDPSGEITASENWYVWSSISMVRATSAFRPCDLCPTADFAAADCARAGAAMANASVRTLAATEDALVEFIRNLRVVRDQLTEGEIVRAP